MCIKVEDFFKKDRITKVCPDTKKMLSIPGKKNAKVPATFRLESLKTLYSEFVAENMGECSFLAFSKHVPFDVIKPKAND